MQPYAQAPAWWKSVSFKDNPEIQKASSAEALWKACLKSNPLHRDGQAPIDPGHPDRIHLEIYLRSLVCNRYLDKDRLVAVTHAPRLALLYQALGDEANTRHWLSVLLHPALPSKEQADAFTTLVKEAPTGMIKALAQEVLAMGKRPEMRERRTPLMAAFAGYAERCGQPAAIFALYQALSAPVPMDKVPALLEWQKQKSLTVDSVAWVANALSEARNADAVTKVMQQVEKALPDADKSDLDRLWLQALRDNTVPEVRTMLGRYLTDRFLDQGQVAQAVAFLDQVQIPVTPDQQSRILAAGQNGDPVVGSWVTPFFLHTYHSNLIPRYFNSTLLSELSPVDLTTIADLAGAAFEKADSAPRRLSLATVAVEAAKALSDSGRIHSFLDVHAERLSEEMPRHAGIWRIQAAIQDGDRDTAREAMNDLQARDDEFRQTREFSELDREIFGMKASLTGPGHVDLRGGAMERQASKLAADGETNALHELVYTLMTREGGMARPDAEDPRLFRSFKPGYRDLLAPLAPGYPDYLHRKFEEEWRSGRLDSDRRLLATHAASLKPEPLPSMGTVRADLDKPPVLRDSPVTLLPMGAFDLRREETRVYLDGRGLTLPSATGLDREFWVQTAISLARVDGGEIRWLQAWNPQPAWDAGSYPLLLSELPAPVVTEDRVLTCLYPDGTAWLGAFDRESGHPAWTVAPSADLKVCSGPALWRDKYVCAQAVGMYEGVETALLVVWDVTQGKEWFRIPTGRTPEGVVVSFLQNGRTQRVRAMHPEVGMPTPVLAGDVAYLHLDSGVVAAVNLADRQLLWLRSYPREQNRRMLAGRMPSRPVVGGRNVLLAPVDARILMLLDRSTGREIKAVTNLGAWRQIQALGDNHVAIAMADRVQVFNLDDLRQTGQLTGGGRLLESTRDGVVVQQERSLGLLRSDGSLGWRVELPENRQVLALSGPNALLANSREPGRILWLGNPAEGELPPARITRGLQVRPAEVRLQTGINGSWLLGRDSLTRLDKQDRVVWTRARSRDGLVLEPRGKTVLFERGRLEWIDPDTGNTLRLWPAPGDVPLRLARIMGDALYAVTDEKVPALIDLSRPEQPRVMGQLPRRITDFQFYPDIAHPVIRDEEGVIRFLNPPENGTTLYTEGKTFKADHRIGWSTMWIGREKDRFWMLDNGRRKGWRGDGGDLVEFKVPDSVKYSKDKRLWTRYVDLHNGIFEFQSGGDTGSAYQGFYNPGTQAALNIGRWRNRESDSWRPMVAWRGRQLAWATTGDTRKGKLTFHLADMDPSPNQPLEIEKVCELPFKARYNTRGAFWLGTDVWTMGYTDRPDLTDKPYMLNRWTPGHDPADPVPFPAVDEVVPLDAEFVMLDGYPYDIRSLEAALRDALDPHAWIDSGDGEVFVDGFADEWSPEDFFTTGRAAVATRRRGDDLWFAIRFTDRGILDRLADSRGVQGMSLSLCRGGMAGFLRPPVMTPGSSLPLSMHVRLDDAGDQGVRGALGMAPDGTEACLEIHWRNGNKVVNEWRARWTRDADVDPQGDLAVRLTLSAHPWSEAVNLLRDVEAGPSSYVRFEVPK